MKICPKCGKKYDDTWKICLSDNSALDAYDGAGSTSKPIIEESSPINEVREGFHLIHYARLFLMAGILPLGFYLMFCGFLREYKMKKSFLAATSSYYGVLLILIIIAFMAGLYLIWKYRKDPTGRLHREKK